MTDQMDDDQLLRLVARSLGDDRPPANAVEAAYAAFAWRTLDADLAQLIEEAQPEVVGFHHPQADTGPSPLPVREMAFHTVHGEIRVLIDPDDGAVAVQVAPAPHRVVQRTPDTDRELAVDPSGRAPAPGASGPTRFEVIWATGTAVTPWLTL